jgi:hypothetical protein
MAAERIPMRKLREVLRLRLACGLSGRAIAQSCRLSGSTVSCYLGRIAVAKLTWSLPPGLDDDAALEQDGDGGAVERLARSRIVGRRQEAVR